MHVSMLLPLIASLTLLPLPVSAAPTPLAIKPFKIEIPQAVLDDTQQRLKLARYPAFQLVDDWSYGTKTDVLKELVDYWRDGYDWRAREKYMNDAFNHFTTEIDGLQVHFIHHKSSEPNAVPLLVSHGWPGSFLECANIIPLLTQKQPDSNVTFDLVCPSLPGFIFSEPSRERHMDASKIASMFRALMQDRLGYKEYVIQGGDWGSVVSMEMCVQDTNEGTDAVKGFHSTFVPLMPPFRQSVLGFLDTIVTYAMPRWLLTERQATKLSAEISVLAASSGYLHEQATRPETIATALMQSPVALLSWYVDAYYTASDSRNKVNRESAIYSDFNHNGDIFNEWTKEEIIDFVALYWLTDSIPATTRLYYEQYHQSDTGIVTMHTTVQTPKAPVAYTQFPAEPLHAIPRLLRHYVNLVQYKSHEKGGHWAAKNTPELLAGDVREFVEQHVLQNMNTLQPQAHSEL